MLGAGFIAEYHLAGLAATGRADVRVVVGRSRDRAEALAARFGIPDAGIDVSAALDREDVQAVIVATPDDTHEAIATAAASAGKSILLQKPMAGSVEGAERIIASAAAHGVDLQVSFMHRFFDEVVAARRLLDENAIGRVLAARIRNATPGPDWGDWFFRKASVRNGVVDQLGVHGVDLVEQLLGRITAVAGLAHTALARRRMRDGTIVDVENADNATAVYTLDGGARVTHEMSMTEVAGTDRFRLEVYGEKGTLMLRTERGRLALHAPALFGADWHVPPTEARASGERQHCAWLDGLGGAAPRLRTADDALRGMRVVEAIMRSSARHGEMQSVTGTA